MSDWIEEAVASLSRFVGVQSVVLSTHAPTVLTESLLAELSASLPGVELHPGHNTVAPKAVGVASLPYHSRFMVG